MDDTDHPLGIFFFFLWLHLKLERKKRSNQSPRNFKDGEI